MLQEFTHIYGGGATSHLRSWWVEINMPGKQTNKIPFIQWVLLIAVWRHDFTCDPSYIMKAMSGGVIFIWFVIVIAFDNTLSNSKGTSTTKIYWREWSLVLSVSLEVETVSFLPTANAGESLCKDDSAACFLLQLRLQAKQGKFTCLEEDTTEY